jgi:hypothetical protein
MTRHMRRVRPLLLVLGLVVTCAGTVAPAQGATLSFSARQTLSTVGTNADVPQVGVDASGGAVVIWREFDGSNFRIRAATRSARGFFGSSAYGGSY